MTAYQKTIDRSLEPLETDSYFGGISVCIENAGMFPLLLDSLKVIRYNDDGAVRSVRELGFNKTSMTRKKLK